MAKLTALRPSSSTSRRRVTRLTPALHSRTVGKLRLARIRLDLAVDENACSVVLKYRMVPLGIPLEPERPRAVLCQPGEMFGRWPWTSDVGSLHS